MARVDVTAKVQGLTSSAAYAYMGELVGTPTEITKTSNNTYTITLEFSHAPAYDIETYILTNGTIESCTIVSGGWKTARWDDGDEYTVYHYQSCTISVVLSQDATYLSIMPGNLIVDGEPADVYCNGVYTSSKFVRWNIKNPQPNYTIKCFIDGQWQECSVQYYDGTKWIAAMAKYYDGTQFVECSF